MPPGKRSIGHCSRRRVGPVVEEVRGSARGGGTAAGLSFDAIAPESLAADHDHGSLALLLSSLGPVPHAELEIAGRDGWEFTDYDLGFHRILSASWSGHRRTKNISSLVCATGRQATSMKGK